MTIKQNLLQANRKFVYVGILAVLFVCLMLDYVPGVASYVSWVTPPVALFLGLAFALLCGQAHPKFNKKMSKYLLQYSVVGLGFGMNLHASLASGKEGMEFTILSVIGTLVIGWFIGRKCLKVDRNTSYLISSAFKLSNLALLSVTYNNNLFPVMAGFVDDMARLGLKNRKVAVVENGTWAPQAGSILVKDLEAMGMEILGEKTTMMSSINADTAEAVEKLADEIAASMR